MFGDWANRKDLPDPDEADAFGTHTGRMCMVRGRLAYCTRSKQHAGDHVAAGLTLVIERWSGPVAHQFQSEPTLWGPAAWLVLRDGQLAVYDIPTLAGVPWGNGARAHGVGAAVVRSILPARPVRVFQVGP